MAQRQMTGGTGYRKDQYVEASNADSLGTNQTVRFIWTDSMEISAIAEALENMRLRILSDGPT